MWGELCKVGTETANYKQKLQTVTRAMEERQYAHVSFDVPLF